MLISKPIYCHSKAWADSLEGVKALTLKHSPTAYLPSHTTLHPMAPDSFPVQ